MYAPLRRCGRAAGGRRAAVYYRFCHLEDTEVFNMDKLLELIEEAIAQLEQSGLASEHRGLIGLKLAEARSAAIRATHQAELAQLWLYAGETGE